MANCCHVYDISAVTATVGVGHWVQLANASQPISQSKQIYIFYIQCRLFCGRLLSQSVDSFS